MTAFLLTLAVAVLGTSLAAIIGGAIAFYKTISGVRNAG